MLRTSDNRGSSIFRTKRQGGRINSRREGKSVGFIGIGEFLGARVADIVTGGSNSQRETKNRSFIVMSEFLRTGAVVLFFGIHREREKGSQMFCGVAVGPPLR